MKKTILTIIACIACLFSFSQDAITLGTDTIYGEITEATPAHIIIDGKKVLTQSVGRIMHNGNWMYKSTYFELKENGNLKRDLLEYNGSPTYNASMHLQKAGTQGALGVGLMVLGGIFAITLEDEAALIAGGIGLAGGVGLQFSAFGHLSKAGKSMQKIPSPQN
jgi:hypothetical protein